MSGSLFDVCSPDLANPVFHFESRHTAEFRAIVGDERKILVQGMRSDEQIKFPDSGTSKFQIGSNRGVSDNGCGRPIKYVYIREETFERDPTRFTSRFRNSCPKFRSRNT